MKRKTVALSSFLMLEAEEEKKEENEDKKELVFIKRHADTVVDHDLVKFGFMLKKSNSR